jgi:hypothetical protein
MCDAPALSAESTWPTSRLAVAGGQQPWPMMSHSSDSSTMLNTLIAGAGGSSSVASDLKTATMDGAV